MIRLAFLCCLASMIWASAIPGQAAPAFTLTDNMGKEHSLSQYAGKVVVLEWVNYNCPFVKKHYSQGHMQALQSKMADKGVVWLSICSSAVGKQGHMDAAGITSKIAALKAKPTAYLVDEDGAVGKAYGAKTTPHCFVIDSKGMIAYAGAIDSIRSVDAADVPKATNYVKNAVMAVLDGKAVSPAQTAAYGCSVKYKR